jgi:hypothetical protein
MQSEELAFRYHEGFRTATRGDRAKSPAHRSAVVEPQLDRSADPTDNESRSRIGWLPTKGGVGLGCRTDTEVESPFLELHSVSAIEETERLHTPSDPICRLRVHSNPDVEAHARRQT